MEKRKLTITVQADWKAALRATGKAAQQTGYQGETLNFQTPVAFFSRLTERRWDIVNALQQAGAMGVRELARYVGRDVKRVHEDAQALVELGLLERTDQGGLLCPLVDIHVDMHIATVQQAA
jgi:predicted transcriptional regulator